MLNLHRASAPKTPPNPPSNHQRRLPETLTRQPFVLWQAPAKRARVWPQWYCLAPGRHSWTPERFHHRLDRRHTLRWELHPASQTESPDLPQWEFPGWSHCLRIRCWYDPSLDCCPYPPTSDSNSGFSFPRAFGPPWGQLSHARSSSNGENHQSRWLQCRQCLHCCLPCPPRQKHGWSFDLEPPSQRGHGRVIRGFSDFS